LSMTWTSADVTSIADATTKREASGATITTSEIADGLIMAEVALTTTVADLTTIMVDRTTAVADLTTTVADLTTPVVTDTADRKDMAALTTGAEITTAAGITAVAVNHMVAGAITAVVDRTAVVITMDADKR
jgi:hypothetical protein